MDLFTSFNLVVVVPLVLLILIHINSAIIFSWKRRKLPLPPGPKPWPIIGNILQLGTKPHVSLTQFSHDHGPLISLKLGSKLLIVGSSPAAAAEILKTQDRLLSARHVPNVNPYDGPELERISLIWAPTCTENWKALRTLCRTELFSAKAIEAQSTLREKKVGEMIEFLATKEGQLINCGEVIFATVFDTLSNVLFSVDLIGLEDQGRASGLKALISKIMELFTTPNIADFYPILAGLDPQGLRRKARTVRAEMFAVWEHIIRERRQGQGRINSSDNPDFLDVFLPNNLSDEHINCLIIELFAAGVDTTVTTIEWAMAELLKNKQVMTKVYEEIRREVNGKPIKESHVSQLPYLSACVKETLRLHPPVPFLLPHRALETCEILNYTIPKDSQVLVNVWAIGRDPVIWNDPLSFNPERFLNSNLDFKGRDYELLPFGAGRRSCPGLPMGSRLTTLILASLIHCFDWYLPNGQDPAKLDMKEKFGLTLQKEKPLLLFLPKSRP